MIPVLSNVGMCWTSAGDAQDRTVDRAERSAASFGDEHGLADADRELAEDTQSDRNVECHARPQLGGNAGVEAEDAALAPVGREGDADAVARPLPEVLSETGTVNHLLATDMWRLARGAGTDRRDCCLKPLLTCLLHIDRHLRHRAEPGAAHQGGVVTIMAGGHFQEDRLVPPRVCPPPRARGPPPPPPRRDPATPAPHIH